MTLPPALDIERVIETTAKEVYKPIHRPPLYSNTNHCPPLLLYLLHTRPSTGQKAKPAREIKQPTAAQLARSVVTVAGDSVLSRLGPKLDECSITISNLNYNISAGDVRELAATVGEVSRVHVHTDSGRADVTFKYKEDAKRAIQRYDRVTLDGRPMRLAIKGAAAAGG
jgi:hypothetical protein